jgi:two-component system, cell cycle response regulator
MAYMQARQGILMRFHRSEIAFAIFMLLLLAAGGAVYFAHVTLDATHAAVLDGSHQSLKTYLMAGGILLVTAIVFGLCFIFPQIRNSAQEGGKLREMTQTLSARSETLEHAALTDALTGMQNRRYFDDALKEYLEEFRRIEKPIGLIVLDLDHFKTVNDTHGHDVGDEVLRQVSGCLRNFTRYHDIAARIGGEEFAVVAPNMDLDGLSKFAERIRRAVSDLVIVSGNVRLKVTTSIGVAAWDGIEAPDSFYRRADTMLYKAKREGRNRVCAAA